VSEPSQRRIFERRSAPAFTRSRAPGQPHREGFHLGNKDYKLYQGLDHQAAEQIESSVLAQEDDDNVNEQEDTNQSRGNQVKHAAFHSHNVQTDEMKKDESNNHYRSEQEKPKHLKHKKFDRRNSNTLPLQTFVYVNGGPDSESADDIESYDDIEKPSIAQVPPQLDDLDDFPCL
jgi:hypothetical protein